MLCLSKQNFSIVPMGLPPIFEVRLLEISEALR